MQIKRNKKSHQHIYNASATVFSPHICPSLHLRSALQSRSWPTFWLMHWGAFCSCVCIPPSQVSPVTGSLLEYRLLHLQQRAKLRTHTGFPNLPHLPKPAVIVGDAMQLVHFSDYIITHPQKNMLFHFRGVFINIVPKSGFF